MKNIFYILLLSCACYVSAQEKVVLKKIDEQAFASLRNKHGAVLEIRAKSPEDLLSLIQVYSGRLDLESPWKPLAINRINSKQALLPYRFLSPPFRKLFLEKLWPKDRVEGDFYIHHISYPHESLWSLSSWFTGEGKNYREIKKVNGLRSDRLAQGQIIKFPVDLLLFFIKSEPGVEIFKPRDPVTTLSTPLKETEIVTNEITRPLVSSPEGETDASLVEADQMLQNKGAKDQSVAQNSQEASETNKETDILLGNIMQGRKELSYGKDKLGPYAVYQLNKGEAIYSAIVVRFCGLVRGEDVNRVSQEIIERNKIKDVTDMPVGQKLRIPYDLLIPEYKASDDPEFLGWFENLKAVENVDTSLLNRGLAGVTVILDSGHGGIDPGAKKGNTWEDDYVYDILCRVKLLLEEKSAANVLPVIMDPNSGYSPQDVNQFKLDKDEVLNTHPRFSLNKSTKLGVNMRWVFANHHYADLLSRGTRPDEVVFISLHADSLHSSLRGSMVYVPDARSYPRTEVTAAEYFRRYNEYKDSSFKAEKHQMEKAQALSTRLAVHFLSELKLRNLPVHNQLPIRSVIFRGPRSRPFVPAVLNYNRIPMRILLEVCNLNNQDDRDLIRSVSYRQQVAESLVASIHKAFGSLAPVQVAKKDKG